MKKPLFGLLCLVALVVITPQANAGTLEDKIIFGDKTSHTLSLFESGKFGNSTIGWSAFFLASQNMSCSLSATSENHTVGACSSNAMK